MKNINNHEIRKACKVDLDIINSFLEKMGQKNINADKLMFHPYDSYYILNYEEKDVAFLSISTIIDRMELNYIYVDSNYRRKHIASYLMNFVIEKAYELDLDNISLEVSVENKEAIKLYVKYEFDTQAIREKYYDDSIDALLMVRWLRK